MIASTGSLYIIVYHCYILLPFPLVPTSKHFHVGLWHLLLMVTVRLWISIGILERPNFSKNTSKGNMYQKDFTYKSKTYMTYDSYDTHFGNSMNSHSDIYLNTGIYLKQRIRRRFDLKTELRSRGFTATPNPLPCASMERSQKSSPEVPVTGNPTKCRKWIEKSRNVFWDVSVKPRN